VDYECRSDTYLIFSVFLARTSTLGTSDSVIENVLREDPELGFALNSMCARLLQPAAKCPGLWWEGPPGKNGVKMPRVTQAWKSDPDRSRYYRLRADRLELQNGLARSQYIERDQLKALLGKFCAGIGSRIAASDLDPALKAEISEDLATYLERIRLSAVRPNAQHNRGEQGRRRAKNR
jgi:hypothetical protein